MRRDIESRDPAMTLWTGCSLLLRPRVDTLLHATELTLSPDDMAALNDASAY